jgi:hypothetical protein
MALFGSSFANLPGMQGVVETFEQAFAWGPYPRYFAPAYISAACADPTNSPTWELRPGLLLGKQFATGQWVNYNPTASDGSQIAAGVLIQGLRMQDILTGVNVAKFFGVMVSGGVQGSKIIGLDNQARAQMAPHFIFDDNLPGNADYEWLSFVSKIANYSIQPTDNFTHFDNIGAAGPVTFTLPPILNGYKFGFRVVANQNLLVTSFEGGNIVAFNNAVANTLAFQTGVQLIGGGVELYSNAAGTKWYAVNYSAGTNVITVS